jgi:hypothetical protein
MMNKGICLDGPMQGEEFEGKNLYFEVSKPVGNAIPFSKQKMGDYIWNGKHWVWNEEPK